MDNLSFAIFLLHRDTPPVTIPIYLHAFIHIYAYLSIHLSINPVLQRRNPHHYLRLQSLTRDAEILEKCRRDLQEDQQFQRAVANLSKAARSSGWLACVALQGR